MKVNKRKKQSCLFCRRWYLPDPRIGKNQKACPKKKCRKARKAQANRSWRLRHPNYPGDKRKLKIKDWSRRTEYWKGYRRDNPGYVARNREQTRLRMARMRLLFAKQDAISSDNPLPKPVWADEMFAKQDAIHRRMEALVSGLIAKGVFAKQDAMDSAWAGGR